MDKLPVITIVGIPNTGKSTLFNRIIGERKALVHNQSGMTRDIYRQRFVIDGYSFFLQDSGGFFPEKDIISKSINKKVVQSAKESQIVIFLFDGKREIYDYERDLYLEIRKINENIIPVINKADNINNFIIPSSYYKLKEDYTLISAEHSHNIDVLFDKIKTKAKELFLLSANNKLADEEEQKLRLSILGKPNVGKSFIINKIFNDEKVIVSPLAGTTRDSVDFEINRLGKQFILVDNAGIRKQQKIKESTESAAVIRAQKDINNADIIIFVIDISKKIDQNDLFIANKVLKSAKPVILALNKWDLVKHREDINKLRSSVLKSLNGFYFAPTITVSALEGKNIFSLIDTAIEINNKLNSTIKKSSLISMVRGLIEQNKVLTEKGKLFRPKYCHIETYKPFFINFFTKDGDRLRKQDEIFLKKEINNLLNLSGIPIFFKISKSSSK